jgi:hypothetical protein
MTFAELLERSPGSRVALQTVLLAEERSGRVERVGDRWRIVRGAFPADLLAALELIELA